MLTGGGSESSRKRGFPLGAPRVSLGNRSWQG
jgi:hypothetical protein